MERLAVTGTSAGSTVSRSTAVWIFARSVGLQQGNQYLDPGQIYEDRTRVCPCQGYD